MKNLLRATVLLGCLGALSPSASAAVSVVSAFMTTAQANNDCSAGGPQTTSFASTAAAAWLYLEVNGTQVGDLASVAWVGPNGSTVLTSNFQPLTFSGTGCFSASLTIAGTSVASTPGSWSVRVTYQGSSLVTVPFTITGTGGGGTGNSSANIVAISLAGGSYNGGTFSPNSNLWNTTNQGKNYLLGVSQAGILSLLNSKTDGSVNIPSSQWANGLWTYDRQCGSGVSCIGPVGALEYGNAVQITINFSNGNFDQAVFNVGSTTSATPWQLISGSATGTDTLILSGTTGTAGVAEVGAGGGAAGLTPSAPNDVLHLCINSCTGGTGGGTSNCTSPGGSGTGLSPAGSVDAHYCIFNSADPAYPGPNAYVSSSLAANWIANSSSPLSQWISARADPSNGNALGSYTYRTTFSLAGLNPSTATLTGRYSTDNTGVILLNGTQVGSASSGYTTWTSFTISTGFVAGVNTLDFVVTDIVGAAINPTGLRVEISGSSSGSPIPVYSTGVAGGGLGNSSASIVAISLAGGSYNGGIFSPNSNLWNTTNQGKNYLLGVSQAGILSLLNSKTDGSVNITPSGWTNGLWTYDRQCGSGVSCIGPVGALEYGNAVQITITFSNGNIDQAVFNVGSPTSATLWQQISGSATGTDTLILSGTTGTAGVAEVGAGGGAAGLTPSAPNDVLHLCINSCTGGTGAGSGGGSTINTTLTVTGTGTSSSGTVTATGTVALAGVGNGTFSANFPLSSGASGSIPITITVTSGSPTGTLTCTLTASITLLVQIFAGTPNVSGPATITITGGTGGFAGASGTFTLTLNGTGTGASGSGSGSFTMNGTGTITLPGSSGTGCSYNVSPTDIPAPAAGLSGTILIFTNSGCPWTASVPSGISWITLTSSSGSGQGGVGYTIAANSGGARSTTLTIAQTSVTVEQGASCYTLSATSSPLISGIGGVGIVNVTVSGSSCSAWTVTTPSVTWVHIAGGGSASSGVVSYTVDPNTLATTRSTTLTIAGQSYTVQQAAAPCNYSLSPSFSSNLAAGGDLASFQINAVGTACPWTISAPTDPNSLWVHIISTSNAAGFGAISYTVDPNNTTSARKLTLTFTGKNPATILTYTVNQAAGAANTAPPPVVSPGGIVNSASYISAYLPAGSIAQGSFFSIFGSNIGPPNPGLRANSYPLSTNLGGVTIAVTQGSTTVAAIPLFVAQYQINAVMPSNAPTGQVQVTVSYNNLTSAPAPATVVVSNFGAFAVAGGEGPGIVQNYVSATQLPLNETTVTAAPGDFAILWGTGLGPLPGGASDTQPPAAGSLPVSVTVLVGGQSITPTYSGRAPGLAGVDQIDFQLPANVALGCFVPVQVLVSGIASNTVTMAINTNRQPCSDASPLSAPSRNGGKNSTVGLAHFNYTDPTNALGSGSADIGFATFSQSSGTGGIGFNLFTSLPPVNTCTYYNNIPSLAGLLAGQLPSAGAGITPLDAGRTITITGPQGSQGLTYSDSTAMTSPYEGVLGTGGAFSVLGLGPSTPFLVPGSYTISGSGGKDVGPFSFPMQFPSGATWTNRDSINMIDRTQGLTFQWSGGTSGQAIVMFGYSSNPATNVLGAFACISDAAPQTFTVPSNFIANLPATPPFGSGNDLISALLFATVPSSTQFVTFNTSASPSLDSGLGYYAIGELRNNVTFK